MSELITHRVRAGRAGLLAAFCLLVALGATSVGAYAWLNQPGSQPAQKKEARVEVEVITAGPEGFSPAEITRPKGRFYLVVDNVAELPALELQLTREAGHSLREQRVPRGQADWAEALDLEPGTYVLREAAHPDWVCRITVTH